MHEDDEIEIEIEIERYSIVVTLRQLWTGVGYHHVFLGSCAAAELLAESSELGEAKQ